MTTNIAVGDEYDIELIKYLTTLQIDILESIVNLLCIKKTILLQRTTVTER